MSHLRAPAARADRREGGRHGRPVARIAPAPAETHIRPQLVRLAVLPPTAVALSACAVVLFTVRSSGVRPGPTLWAVLAGAAAVTGVGIVIAAVAADRAARSVSDRIAALRRGSARGEADLRAAVEALRRGEVPPQRASRGGLPAGADDFELLAADLARAHDGAVTAVVQAAQLSSQTGSEQKLEVFVNLARRLQSLVHREISILDELENEIEDPDLLKGLFHVDHLATRIRRHAENLAVLGGAVSRRQWSNPVPMTEVLRSAIAEVEQYARVKLVPPVEGELRGHAVADVIHLLAELVENATVFSAPHTQVLLRANLVTSGLAVEVEDRGLGLPVEEQSRMNALLADPDQVNVGRLLADGRIGLFVVSQLARRHGIRVRLQSNIYGGVQAVLVVPQALLGSAPGVLAAASPGPDTDGAGRPLVPATPSAVTPVATPRTTAVAPPLPAVSPTRPGRPGPRLVAGDERTTARDTRDAGRPFAPADAPAHVTAAAHTRTELSSAQAYPQTQDAASVLSSGGGMPGGAGVQSAPARPPGPTASSPARNTPEPGERAGLLPPQGASGAGRTSHAPQTPETGAPRGDGDRPIPLPVRDARAARPNPAEAVPGIRSGDRPVVEEHEGIAPTPRVGTVRGTMGKPHLPRRRAQEHIVPQLRGGPAPRPDVESSAGHDPGLMAAFQRGVGLAEAQQSLQADAAEPAPYPPTDSSQPTTRPEPYGSQRAFRPEPHGSQPAARPEPSPTEQPWHTGSLHPSAQGRGEHPDDAGRSGGATAAAARGVPLPLLPPAPLPVDTRRAHRSQMSEARPAHAAAPPEAYGARGGPDLPEPDRSTARHDGSAPAG
ncbi:ATP-binding protein [Streptomyces sp. P3]|uniref:sensor histidine kinase n=1 Tax=Streptomyces sp. P3 TaxID=2135430 RepID=UPI000D1A1736|nr:ATP-binding protein [Streptomyces sp. P3]AVV45798.1 ATP-binding protein [Streptomyces sp. P3]